MIRGRGLKCSIEPSELENKKEANIVILLVELKLVDNNHMFLLTMFTTIYSGQEIYHAKEEGNYHI